MEKLAAFIFKIVEEVLLLAGTGTMERNDMTVDWGRGPVRVVTFCSRLTAQVHHRRICKDTTESSYGCSEDEWMQAKAGMRHRYETKLGIGLPWT